MEWVLIHAIILFIFGPGNLPGIGRFVGQPVRNYMSAISGKKEEEMPKI